MQTIFIKDYNINFYFNILLNFLIFINFTLNYIFYLIKYF